MSGYVALHREAREHPLFAGDVARFGAFFWLVATACWRPTPFNVRGTVITLQRGQLCVSIRQLAEAWGWSKSSVERFLTRLETETMILREAGHGRCIITVCNYNTYQERGESERDTSGTPSGTPAGHQRDTKEEGNKGIREEEPIGSPSQSVRKASKTDACAQVVEHWNAMAALTVAPNHLSPCTLTAKRRSACNARIREHGLATIRQAIDHIPKCSFVLGVNDRGWKGDIDWLLRPDSVTRILEGKYDDRPAQQPGYAPRDTRDGFTRALDRELERLASQPSGSP